MSRDTETVKQTVKLKIVKNQISRELKKTKMQDLQTQRGMKSEG